MAGLTPEQHADDCSLAIELIDDGQVTTWKQLGAAFGITAQAACSRFGKIYGLRMPPKTRVFRRMVSVTLDEDTDRLLEALRAQYPSDAVPSRAQIVRDILRAHLLGDQQHQIAA